MMLTKSSLAPACLAVLLSSANTAYAWGALGHRTVALIADNYVKSATSTWINDILGEDIASIASWADSYDHTTAGEWSAELHYIDAEDSPPDTCHVTYPSDCGSGGCVVSAIANFTDQLQDSSLSSSKKIMALEFIVHFLGDITQPLHTDSLDGTGGNTIDVTWDGESVVLHHVWDTSIAESIAGGSTDADATSWSKTLIKSIDSGTFKSEVSDWISCIDITDAENCALEWAQDSNALVCTQVVPDGVSAVEKGDLADTYGPDNEETVSRQIAKGGYRLAKWLDALAAAA